MSFLAEHASPARRGFLGSWSAFTVVLGSLLGSGVAALCTGLLTEAQLTAWGWRLPFLSGLLIGAFGFWLRLGVEESPSFLSLQKAGKLARNPIVEAFRNNFGAIATTLGLSPLTSVAFYLPFVWLPTWLAHINRPALSEDEALLANTIALFVLLFLTPVTAVISDRVGRKPMFLAGALGFALFSYPVFLLLTGGTFFRALVGGLIFASCSSLPSGCMAATMIELFPTRTRYTGVAIGYNVGQALLGGTAPFVATALIHLTGNELAPAFYLIAAALVATVSSLYIKSLHGRPLQAE